MRIAVLVVDMIDDFVVGKFGSTRAEMIVPVVKNVLSNARTAGVPVVYVHDSHTGDDLEMNVWGPHAMENSEGSEIVLDLKPEPGDIVISKKVYSGFFRTELEDRLKDIGIDTLLVAGVSTDICVQHNVADAFYRGLRSMVLEDATATIDPETHQDALVYMQRIYGAEIITSEKAIDMINKGE